MIDIISDYLDRWVSKHGEYVPEDFVPPKALSRFHIRHAIVASTFGIQQVRREIIEFVKLIIIKGLNSSILEIGLGYYGGGHMLWRQLFNRVVTIESSRLQTIKFRMAERLDSRSTIVIGKSQDLNTLKKVQNIIDNIDVLFIDGDHSYTGVAGDWRLYHSLVRPGGIVAFHDSACKIEGFGVAQFIHCLSTGSIDGKCYEIHSICYSKNVGIAYYEVL